MENTRPASAGFVCRGCDPTSRLLPSSILLELQIDDDDLHLISRPHPREKIPKCAMRKKIVNAVVCISGSIAFIGVMSFMYLGKWLIV